MEWGWGEYIIEDEFNEIYLLQHIFVNNISKIGFN